VKRLPLSTGETQRTHQRRRRGTLKSWSIILCFGFSISVTAQTSEWRYYGGDSGGQRYSELKQINTDNVTSLKRAWTYHTGELELGLSTSPFQASFSCTPLVVKGVMYVSTPSSRVIALDAETGTELWRFDPQADKRVREFNSHRGVAYWEDKTGKDRRILFGTVDGRLIALNANTALAQLRSTPPILDEMDDIIRDIERDALRANEVISGVRAIFKPASDNRGATRVNDLARRALTLSEPDLVANQVSVTTGFLDDQVQVEVDAVQIQQVILNLLRNAIEAMATVAPEARRLKVMTEIREGSTILLSVQDAGGGVPAEDRDRIFDTFFTTKDAGMGLGLAISRTIAENHGGTLRLAWSGSKGSIFELALPAKLA